MGELVMRFLGAAELAVDGVPVHLRRRRALALLAYLVLTGRPHPREALAALLSGAVDDSQARKLLRNALTDLGEHGINDFLLIDRQTVAFDTTRPHRLDVTALDDLLATTVAPDTAALERAAAQLDQELLAGLVLRDAPLFESWVERERERRADQLVRTVNRLLEDRLRADEAEAGIALARRLLAARPWHEETHRILMRLLAHAGRHDDALEQYALCLRALADELGAEPQPETTALYEQLRAGPVAPRHNVAAPAPDPIGREEELAELARLLADPACRLVSLVGLGGVGKTRLALAAAARLALPAPLAADHPFPDGIFLVDLSGITGTTAGGPAAAQAERRIVMAIGLALGLVFYGNVDRRAQLVAYLRPKRLLLVLDHLERLRPGVGALQALLRECPGVTLLVTARARLGVPEEYVRELGGLALPDGADALELAPAGRLFLHEARRLNVRLAPADRPAIARICRLTDGLPLALLIAAGWLRALSCAEIARELESGRALFGRPARDQPAGGESLSAIMASVWRGLSQRERRALRRLSVFRGRFDRAACEAIGVALPSLLALCEQSLLERDGDDRYTLHQLVRQYGAEQLARLPAEETRVRARHAAHFAAVLARHAADLHQRPEAQAAIGADRADIRAAWEWAVAHLDLGLVMQLRDGLALWHESVGLDHEWSEALAEAVERLRAHGGSEPALRVTLGWLLVARAGSLIRQRELDRAYPLLVEARQAARTVGMVPLEAWTDLYEGHILRHRGDARAGAALLRRALTLAQAIGERRVEAAALEELGAVATDVGDFAEAEAHLLGAEQTFREIGDRLRVGRIAIHRARASIALAEFARARAHLEQALPLVRAFGDRLGEFRARVFMGVICDTGLGRHQAAAAEFARALRLGQELGDLRAEAIARWGQSGNALDMGDFAGADQLCEQAIDLARLVGSPAVLGRALHARGRLAHARGDDVAAEDLAQRALGHAAGAGRRQELARDTFLLGLAREGLGLRPEARAAYAQTLALARELAMPALCCDAEAGLASLALGGGEVDRAAEHAAALVPYLREHGLGGCDEPGRVVLTCYRALRAAGDPRAAETLRLGAALLQQRAAALPAEWRPRYLEAFPARREVLRRWRQYEAVADRSATPPVSLFPVESSAARAGRQADDASFGG